MIRPTGTHFWPKWPQSVYKLVAYRAYVISVTMKVVAKGYRKLGNIE